MIWSSFNKFPRKFAFGCSFSFARFTYSYCGNFNISTSFCNTVKSCNFITWQIKLDYSFLSGIPCSCRCWLARGHTRSNRVKRSPNSECAVGRSLRQSLTMTSISGPGSFGPTNWSKRATTRGLERWKHWQCHSTRIAEILGKFAIERG